MTQDGLCNRPNKDGTPCKNLPLWDTACNVHLTDDERRSHHAEKDYEWRIQRAQWEEDARVRRAGEMTRYLAGFLEKFAPLNPDETDFALDTLAALVGALRDV